MAGKPQAPHGQGSSLGAVFTWQWGAPWAGGSRLVLREETGLPWSPGEQGQE